MDMVLRMRTCKYAWTGHASAFRLRDRVVIGAAVVPVPILLSANAGWIALARFDTDMASYHAATVQPSGMRTVSQEDNEVSLMLANALRKMDGLIGDCRYCTGSTVGSPLVYCMHEY